MPRFRYRALRQAGGEIEGELVADDEREAVSHLQSAGTLPIEIAPAASRTSGYAARALAPRDCRRANWCSSPASSPPFSAPGSRSTARWR